MRKVWVLLFGNPGEQEGIYSIKVNEENLIVAFAEEDDATRYGLMLEAQDFFTPRVEAIDLEELEEFCQEYDYRLRVIEANELMTPPATNVEKTDWQREPSQAEIEAMRQQLERLLRWE
ncbi:MAG: DUF3110 domain-containing protein [Pseudanabaenaceae cyanobacterium]